MNSFPKKIENLYPKREVRFNICAISPRMCVDTMEEFKKTVDELKTYYKNVHKFACENTLEEKTELWENVKDAYKKSCVLLASLEGKPRNKAARFLVKTLSDMNMKIFFNSINHKPTRRLYLLYCGLAEEAYKNLKHCDDNTICDYYRLVKETRDYIA